MDTVGDFKECIGFSQENKFRLPQSLGYISEQEVVHKKALLHWAHKDNAKTCIELKISPQDKLGIGSTDERNIQTLVSWQVCINVFFCRKKLYPHNNHVLKSSPKSFLYYSVHYLKVLIFCICLFCDAVPERSSCSLSYTLGCICFSWIRCKNQVFIAQANCVFC